MRPDSTSKKKNNLINVQKNQFHISKNDKEANIGNLVRKRNNGVLDVCLMLLNYRNNKQQFSEGFLKKKSIKYAV